jgi:hypothetical protein
MTIGKLLAIMCACAGGIACSEASDSSDGELGEGAYASPATPTIAPGTLRGFDISPTGEVSEVPVNAAAAAPPANTANWDWGDEGAHTPSGSGWFIEVEDLLSPGYVMMGVGARVALGAVTRMRLRQIRILDDWSWDPAGPALRNWVRHSADDGGNLAELEIAIQEPYVAVGIGFGITDQNVSSITMRKRQYSPTQHQLVGEELVDSVGTGASELYWDTSFITQPVSQKEKMVLVGLGLREIGDNLTTLRVWAAYLD